MRSRIVGFLIGATLLAAGTARAQVAWDAPLLIPPGDERMFGLFLMEPAGGDIGIMAHLRPVSIGNRSGLGLRAGIAENEDDDFSAFGGLDFARTVLRVGEGVPVDLDWILGAGLGAGEEGVIISVPVAITVGRTFTFEENRFTPYLIPKVIVDIFLGDDEELEDFDDDVDLEVGVDLGIDYSWDRRWVVRFGATLSDDREGIAIGFVWRY